MKENFLAGLPTLLGEQVGNKIRESHDGQIPYKQLSCGELISFIHKEGLHMCTQHKLQKQLKKEKFQTRKELGTFCQQF